MITKTINKLYFKSGVGETTGKQVVEEAPTIIQSSESEQVVTTTEQGLLLKMKGIGKRAVDYAKRKAVQVSDKATKNRHCQTTSN